MTELQLQTGAYRTTFIGTEILRESTLNEWRCYGEILKRVDEAKQWAIGDWLVDGKRHYGDGLYKEAEQILGIGYNYLARQKRIADMFEFSSRLLKLSFEHYSEVSSIKQIEEKNGKLQLSNEPDMDKMQWFLKKAESDNLSVRELREQIKTYKRRQQEEIRLANEPEKFAVILADPAWEYDFSRTDSRRIENQYMPSTLEEMKRLKIPSANDCVLFMWATNPKLEQAIELVNAWGFEYKTNLVWVKDKIGMGYYGRQMHELVFIATKGNIELSDEDKRPESVFHSPRTEHSIKPDIIYEIIETMYPEYNKLEMFSRKERNGWKSWGDEAE